MENVKITIAICTYNRAELLKDCLDSFISSYQNFDSNLYEVLVVNNNSNDTTQELAQSYAEKYDNFRVVVETNQGLSHARNRAYKEAKGEWIAYIDDDARGHKNYIIQLSTNIDTYCFDAIGGPCIPLYHINKPIWYKESYQNAKKILEIGELKKGFIDGFNSVFKKVTLEKLDGFNTNIGMTGKKVAYGEETELQIKIRNMDGVIYFDPNLLVDHYIDNYKLNLLWFLKSSYANGRDSWVTFHQKPTFFKLFKLLASIFYNFFKNGIINAPNLFKRNYYMQNYVIDTFQTSSNSLGKLVSGCKILLGGRI
jgi:glycosyltransferase involved in cell wall biosynthesis